MGNVVCPSGVLILSPSGPGAERVDTGEKKWRIVEASGRFWSMGFLSRLPRPAVGRSSGRAAASVAGLAANLVRQPSHCLTRRAKLVEKLVPQGTRNPPKGRESNSRTSSRFPTKGAERRRRGADGARRLRGKFLGKVGRMSFGASTRASTITDCSPWILAGAILAAAVSFVLLSFGSGLGLAVASPSSTWRDTSAALALVGGLWL